jgi:hypothetical protein
MSLQVSLKRVALVCAAIAVTAGLGGQPALAASGSAAVADCNATGTLTHHYTVDQLRNALATMSADVKEYTDCYDVIERQLLSQLAALHDHGSSGSGGGGGSFLPAPLIVAIVVLLLAAGGLGLSALRRKRPSP